VSEMTAPSLQDRLRALYATHPLIIEAADALDALSQELQTSGSREVELEIALDAARARIAWLERGMKTFTDPASWYDEPGRLQWAGKRHAVEYAEAMLFTVDGGLLDPARAEVARIAELEAALRPFAELADIVAAKHPGWDHDAFHFGSTGMVIPLKPFRAARALLEAPRG
jgi:hypothetical protein